MNPVPEVENSLTRSVQVSQFQLQVESWGKRTRLVGSELMSGRFESSAETDFVLVALHLPPLPLLCTDEGPASRQ